MSQGVQADKVRFGVFEADLRAGELRKHGIRIHLQRQPFKILVALMERPGELVTREELRQRIWGPEIAVDFDHALGTAVNKLREALSDSAETPRYIETLAKRGFRFISPLEPIGTPAVSEQPKPAVSVSVPELAPKPEDVSTPAMAAVPLVSPLPLAPRRHWSLIFRCAAALALLLALAAVWPGMGSRLPTMVRFSKITSDYRIYPGAIDIERFPGVATDGVRVFFPDFQNGRVGLAYVLVGGGEVHHFATPSEISRPSVADISRDGAELLIRSLMWAETEQPLWIASSTGDSARRLFDVLAHDAAWTPDGKSVLYASGQDLFLVELGGGKSRRLATLSGRAYWMRYSPDGSSIRFTVLDPKTRATSLWEISSGGKDSHPILAGWSNPPAECCGNWTADGRRFVFQSAHDGKPNLWGLQEASFLRRSHRPPFEITAGPLEYFAPVPALRGDQLFCIGANTRRELFHLNLVSQRAEPYLSHVRGAQRPEHAHHAGRISWIGGDGTLWRGNEDGTERVQVIAAPMSVYMARWSEDDSRLLVMAKRPGTPYQIYSVSSDGGEPQVLFDESRNQADPDWGPGGNAVVFGRLPNYAAEAAVAKDIRILDLASKSVSILPQSTGMFCPRWSPDGRYIAAMTLDQHRLMVFDRKTDRWSPIAEGIIHNPVWSRDGKYLYFQAFQEDEVPIFRVSVADRRLERICDRNVVNSADSIQFWGLAPDGGPIGSFVFWSADMYSLNWNQAQ
jgi:Tol biopolymer transport system component/DNA-binding winged helix-turn-helix (wHTH) protein